MCPGKWANYRRGTIPAPKASPGRGTPEATALPWIKGNSFG